MTGAATDYGKATITISGHPTDEEIAAVVAILARRTRPSSEQELDTSSGWARYWHRAQRPLRPAPGAWRRSLR